AVYGRRAGQVGHRQDRAVTAAGAGDLVQARPGVEVRAGGGPDTAVGVLVDPDAPGAVAHPQHGRSLVARGPQLALAAPPAGEAGAGPVLDVLGGLVLGEGVVGAAGFDHVRVDVVVAEAAHRGGAAPGGQRAVLGGEDVRAEAVGAGRLGDAHDDPDGAAFDVELGRPGEAGVGDAGADAGHVRPVDQVGAGGDVEVGGVRGPRLDGVGDVVEAVVPDDAGVAQRAGRAAVVRVGEDAEVRAVGRRVDPEFLVGGGVSLERGVDVAGGGLGG